MALGAAVTSKCGLPALLMTDFVGRRNKHLFANFYSAKEVSD